MLNKFLSFFGKYWIAIIALVVVVPFSVFAAEQIGGKTYTKNSAIVSPNSGIVTLTYFSKSITIDTSKLSGSKYYKAGFSLLVPNATEAEFSSFLSSSFAAVLTGSCSSDCTGKACGALNGCGNVCKTGTCSTSGYTCSEAGVCTCVNTCGTKNCGVDTCGNVCGGGTCADGSYCDNGTCATCSCTGDNCGFDQCGNACGTCVSPRKCVQSWDKDIFYQCIFCTANCAEGKCGSDGCGGYCGCEIGKACDATKGICGPCSAKCDSKECGDDGCGGSCGTCKAGNICVAGKCEVCEPAVCDGTTCGDDGCGGTCSCGEGMVCGVNSKCYACDPSANCVGKSDCAPDGCGGTCGGKVCDEGMICNQFAGCQACSCDGKSCGGDGCGEKSCGSCDTATQICTAPWGTADYLNYNCVDCPNDGRECGYSECGRYYGPCTDGKTCIDGGCK